MYTLIPPGGSECGTFDVRQLPSEGARWRLLVGLPHARSTSRSTVDSGIAGVTRYGEVVALKEFGYFHKKDKDLQNYE